MYGKDKSLAQRKGWVKTFWTTLEYKGTITSPTWLGEAKKPWLLWYLDFIVQQVVDSPEMSFSKKYNKVKLEYK